MITVLTGIVRSDGSAVLLFSGLPDRAVAWDVSAGAVTPFADHTDAWGRAYAKYDAGGWEGPVTVQVVYGS